MKSILLLCLVTVVLSDETVKSPIVEKTEPILKDNPVPVTTTSTPKPITTTTAAPSTTSAPTTSSTTAAPTTAAPTTQAPTTTSAPVTTTVKPASNKWVLMDNQTVCLIATMKIKFEIPYNDSKPVAAMGRLEVPETAEVSGFCNSTNMTYPQTLTLTWRSPNNTNPNATNWVKFTFTSNSNVKTASSYNHYWISSVEANLFVNDSVAFPNMTGKFSTVRVKNETERFSTPLGSSYACGPASNMPLSVSPALVEGKPGQLVLASVQFEAFMKSKDATFSSAIDCESSHTPDLVPILVGSFLIILVIIVLAAYIIARRRALSRGYLSM